MHDAVPALVLALHQLMEYYVLVLGYALAALALSLLAQWYVRTSPTTDTTGASSVYTDAEHQSIARLHLRYRNRH